MKASVANLLLIVSVAALYNPTRAESQPWSQLYVDPVRTYFGKAAANQRSPRINSEEGWLQGRMPVPGDLTPPYPTRVSPGERQLHSNVLTPWPYDSTPPFVPRTRPQEKLFRDRLLVEDDFPPPFTSRTRRQEKLFRVRLPVEDDFPPPFTSRTRRQGKLFRDSLPVEDDFPPPIASRTRPQGTIFLDWLPVEDFPRPFGPRTHPQEKLLSRFLLATNDFFSFPLIR